MEFGELSRAVLADVARCVEGVDPGNVDALVDALAAKRRVVLVGTGRSGAVLRAMAVRLGHLGVEARVLGSADHAPIEEGDLVLAGSGSGETPVPLKLTEAAHHAGAKLVVITAAPGSAIARLAQIVVHIPAPVTPQDGTPHTLRSLFEECLLIVCDCVCRLLQERLGLSTDDMQARHSPVE